MSKFNKWFLSLENGRQDVLKEDKWRLAEAAFDAGLNYRLPKALEDMPKPFQAWMRGQTVPVLEDGRQGYYLADYERWFQGNPVID